MIVALGMPGLRLFLMRKVEIDAEYVGTIKAKADAGGISGRTAEQIGVGYASKKTVNRRPVGVVNDDGLAMYETLQTTPARIGRRWSGVIGQGLRDASRRDREGNQEEQEWLHVQRC